MRRRMSLVALLLASGCSFNTPPPQRDVVSSFEFEMGFEPVWSATVQSLAQMSVPIDILDKDSGLITIDWIDLTNTPQESWCDCSGLSVFYSENWRRGKFNVFVKQTGGVTTLQVNTQFEQEAEATEDIIVRTCTSTGELEARIRQLVDSNL